VPELASHENQVETAAEGSRADAPDPLRPVCSLTFSRRALAPYFTLSLRRSNIEQQVIGQPRQHLPPTFAARIVLPQGTAICPIPSHSEQSAVRIVPFIDSLNPGAVLHAEYRPSCRLKY